MSKIRIKKRNNKQILFQLDYHKTRIVTRVEVLNLSVGFPFLNQFLIYFDFLEQVNFLKFVFSPPPPTRRDEF